MAISYTSWFLVQSTTNLYRQTHWEDMTKCKCPKLQIVYSCIKTSFEKHMLLMEHRAIGWPMFITERNVYPHQLVTKAVLLLDRIVALVRSHSITYMVLCIYVPQNAHMLLEFVCGHSEKGFPYRGSVVSIWAVERLDS